MTFFSFRGVLHSKKSFSTERKKATVSLRTIIPALTSNSKRCISAGLSKLIDQGTFVKPRVHKLNVFNLQHINAVYELVSCRAGEVLPVEFPRDVAWRVTRHDTAQVRIAVPADIR